jgi:hypothetical protein
MVVKNSAQARRASKSRASSEPFEFVSPVFAGIERPVTTKELAAHLSVTMRTIFNYREQRLIPFWRINSRRILYRISDVERALSRNNV